MVIGVKTYINKTKISSMKTIALFVSILFMGYSSTVNAGNAEVKEELKKVIKFENNKLPIEKNEAAFVKVSFKIDRNGKIQILEANYSDVAVKEALVNKLDQVQINEAVRPDEIYYYNFVFKKS